MLNRNRNIGRNNRNSIISPNLSALVGMVVSELGSDRDPPGEVKMVVSELGTDHRDPPGEVRVVVS